MSILTSKENWKLFSRKAKSFWIDYRRNKIGLLGATTIVLYIFVAFASPWLITHHPIRDTRLAQGFAMPEWVTILPQNADLPRTIRNSIFWNVSENPQSINIQWGEHAEINYLGGEIKTAHVWLLYNFNYPHDTPPQTFQIEVVWAADNVHNLTYSINLGMVRLNDTVQPLWWFSSSEDGTGNAFINSEGTDTFLRLGLNPISDNVAERVFSGKGEYGMLLHVIFMPKSKDATCKFTIKDGELRILGLVHGLLGTDNAGRDIYSQLVAGVVISLQVGLLAAVLSTSIGVVVGVVSGYTGGVVDEITMRTVDILLCLPVLPLLLTLMFIYGKSPYYLILIIAVFWWLGLSRIIRSQVLSLREMPFIEAAKAAGAGRFYTVFRHLIPNVLPVAFANMVLAVPGAIITEAALSFLGFGQQAVPTWGKMLNHAFNYGAFSHMAWWWIFPPGLAIVGLCLAFVFVGHAVDEIANPRLRRRR
jgi:ABC-type dipeptide/oligopeptide/nickel transport system permease subunit